MSVMSVTGPISVEALGITLPHEHLFIDLRNQYTEPADPGMRRLGRQKVRMSNLGLLRRNPYALADNLLLDDPAVIRQEVRRFKRAGGRTIVDCTSLGIHRDAHKLLELAQATGVQIIAGTGYYTADTHPAAMNDWTAEEIAGQMIADLTVGIDGTPVRAGVIGEIGTNEPMHPNERKSLQASALAFHETGVPIYVHIFPWGKTGLEAAWLLLRAGVDPAKIVICHTDVEPDIDYIQELFSLGIFLEFDNFGKEFYIDPADRAFADGIFIQDSERVRLLRQLVDDGYARQLLITNDICLKMMLHAYGGWGYDHILRNIVPMLRHEGIAQETIDLFLVGNPRRLFA
ncbi:MAG TPA: phosphotriesterase-related protein [Armatimonadota bacterium]